MGFEEKTNRKAVLGEVLHAAAELLALWKLNNQLGENKKEEIEWIPATDGKIAANLVCPEIAVDLSFLYYKKKHPEFNFNEADKRLCNNWMTTLLTIAGGNFDPRGREIISAEHYFDIEIKEPWAFYSYNHPLTGEKIEGYLRIKGTVDLILGGDSSDSIEVVDWKTGKRLNWSTGEVKSYEYLQKDKQLNLYYYALSHKFPSLSHIIMTIVYLADGGPTSVVFDRSDLPRIEKMLRQEFELVKNDINPKQNFTWKCDKFCTYSKSNNISNGKSCCQFIKEEVNKLGMEDTTKKYMTENSKIQAYGDGGGKNRKNG